MAETTANDVANVILARYRAKRRPISNLELQKLVYYCQAWCIALLNRTLFADRIEAWVHGPVIPSLYRRFKAFGWNPITEVPPATQLSPEATGLIDEVLRAYGKFKPWELERLTHQEAPWIRARAGLPPDAESKAEISVRDMAEYYSSKAKRA